MAIIRRAGERTGSLTNFSGLLPYGNAILVNIHPEIGENFHVNLRMCKSNMNNF